jgi:lipopolysaccharide biosynthesis regulator YciM
MWELLFFLLPLAALSGWVVGRRCLTANRTFEKLLGLSDLISTRPEKAADVLVQWLETNQEPVETYLTLGSIFRRRGEVDKAIGIHQNLITKPTLTQEQRALSLLELSRDYMRAGVLDRAENGFKELINQGLELEASSYHLIDIYQQSKDWLRAIETAEKLQKQVHCDMRHHIAHFYCELAEQRWLKGDSVEAHHYLKKALNVNSKCVRVSLLTGDIEAHSGQFKHAIKAYQQVQKQDKAFVSEIVLPLARCYENLGSPEGLVKYLGACLENNPVLSVVLAFSDWLYKNQDKEEAVKFLVEHLRINPSTRGLNQLVQFTVSRAEGTVKADLQILQELMQKVVATKPLYRCQACGFSARTLQWQCPGCKRWDVIKPIHE